MNDKKKTEYLNYYVSLVQEKSINLSQATTRLANDLCITEGEAFDMLNPHTVATKHMIESASKYMSEDVEDEEEDVEDEETDDVDATEAMDVDPDWAKHYTMAQEVAKWADGLSEHEDAKIVELAWKVETAIKNILPTIKEMEEII